MARKLDQILVIDLESTCWKGNPPAGQTSEIIEIGLCPVDVGTLERLEKKSILVKPEHSEISAFCSELTTLKTEDFQDAGTLKDALHQLKSDYHSQNRLWASWGDYDRRQFERVCKKAGLKYPFGTTHLNVKNLFATAMGLSHEIGLDGAYDKLSWEMTGTHHRGHDDAWNIAGVLCHLLKLQREHLK